MFPNTIAALRNQLSHMRQTRNPALAMSGCRGRGFADSLEQAWTTKPKMARQLGKILSDRVQNGERTAATMDTTIHPP